MRVKFTSSDHGKCSILINDTSLKKLQDKYPDLEVVHDNEEEVL